MLSGLHGKTLLLRRINLIVLVSSPPLQPTNTRPPVSGWEIYTETLFLTERKACPESLFRVFIQVTPRTSGIGWMS